MISSLFAQGRPPEAPVRSAPPAGPVRIPRRFGRIPGLCLAGLICLALLGLAAGARAQGLERDTLRVRLELGANTDYTNEIYYLDSLATPTVTRRERFDLPQGRSAGVVLASVEGTRGRGASHYSLTQELQLGDLLKRATAIGRWRVSPAPEWRFLFAPRGEYRRDRTLDRDFEETDAAASARLRRSWNEESDAAELGIQGDWLHTTGAGAGILPDRWAVGGTASLEHSDFEGLDWRAHYHLRSRVFPDSSVRDHIEHETEGRARHAWGAGNALTLDGAAIRRFTRNVAPTSLDNFWQESGSLDLATAAAGRLGWLSRFEFDAVQFDLEDDLLYFDHQQYQAQTGVRLQPPSNWTLMFGPRAEWLVTKRAPTERYVEAAGFVEFEAISAEALWSLTPSVGRREYGSNASATAADGFPTGQSSYSFAGLDLFGDQKLPFGWRIRAASSTRWEFHSNSVENSGSLYFSVDVRRLF